MGYIDICVVLEYANLYRLGGKGKFAGGSQKVSTRLRALKWTPVWFVLGLLDSEVNTNLNAIVQI